jgi:hypothetical protein
MILGYDGGERAQLPAAYGAAAERSTVPWTSTSFLGRALSSEGVSPDARWQRPDCCVERGGRTDPGERALPVVLSWVFSEGVT